MQFQQRKNRRSFYVAAGYSSIHFRGPDRAEGVWPAQNDPCQARTLWRRAKTPLQVIEILRGLRLTRAAELGDGGRGDLIYCKRRFDPTFRVEFGSVSLRSDLDLDR